MPGKVYVYGRGDKLPDDIVTFNVTSRSKSDMFCSLSPFYLGPVQVEPLGDGKAYECKVFENAWQHLKQYPQHLDDEAYLVWAMAGFKDAVARRFPMGRGAAPMHSLWKGEKLGYIEARMKVYAPLYAAAVESNPKARQALQCLKDLYESGENIALFDFDGYNYIHNHVTLESVMYNKKRKMGHAFVLAMMITGDRVWERSYDPSKEHSSSMKRST